MKRLKVKFIVNPKSGKSRFRVPSMKFNPEHFSEFYTSPLSVDNLVSLFKEEANKHDYSTEIFYIAKEGDAKRASIDAVNRNFDLVVVAGGDGTINTAINGLANSNIPLAIIPFGTQNALALEFGIPADPKKAIKLIFSGKKKVIDLGIANGSYFMMCCGVGFDAHAVKITNKDAKNIFGGWSYVGAAFHSIFDYQFPKLTIKIKDSNSDSKKIKGLFCIIMNINHYAGSFNLGKEGKIDDGFLELYVFKKKDLFYFIALLFFFMFKFTPNFKGLHMYRVKEIDITCDYNVPYQVDGDLSGLTPIKISVAKKALTVIVKK